MFGEGDYALTAVKQIEATEAFMLLDEDDRKCQGEESLQECEAKEYIEMGKARCECIPYHLISNFETVSMHFSFLQTKVTIFRH